MNVLIIRVSAPSPLIGIAQLRPLFCLAIWPQFTKLTSGITVNMKEVSIMNNIIVSCVHRGSCLSATLVATPLLFVSLSASRG